MKVTLIPALILAALVTVSCASKTNQPTQDWATAAERADTPEAHEALAKHFDEIAQTMQADADAERRALADYQARPHRYGRRIKDLRARSGALLRDFEASANDSRAMAQLHREIAAEMR
jgi:hypothetical protein